jgi:LacI family transcriptional regulator
MKLRVHTNWVVTGDMRVEGGERAMAELLETRHRPTAVLTSNDLMAIGALQAALHAGVRIPADISIVGFDDLPIASMVVPPLTTILLPRRQIAAEAFTSLLQATRDGTRVECNLVHPRLVIRKSTGPSHGR